MAAVRNLSFVLSGQDKSASKTFQKVGKEAETTRSKITGMGAAFAGGALAAGAISFGKASVAAFQESQEAQERLNFAFSKFPKLSDVNADALRDYNSELARKTKYDDDAIASGQAVMAQFGLTGKQLKATTPLLLDYAAATGQDLPTAATTLGKAMAGNAKALKSIGINYKSTGNAGKDFENIQRLVNEKVGGFAEKEGKTAAGQAAILANQYGEIQEEVGSKLLPVLTTMGVKLLDTIDFVQRNDDVIKPLVITVGGFAAAVWTVNKAMIAVKATTAAATAVKALFTTATVAEGRAASAAAVQVTALATAQTAAAASGTAAAAGITATTAAATAGAAAFSAYALAAGAAAAGLYAFWKLGTQVGDGGGNSTFAPSDPLATGGTGMPGYKAPGPTPAQIGNRKPKAPVYYPSSADFPSSPRRTQSGDSNPNRPRQNLVLQTDRGRLTTAVTSTQQERDGRGYLGPS